ncbi:MAG: iron-sulfur cluster assembly accessory protein [Capsulimonadales bacterium]|nr:iron-sulfur cluster assembly accessory protein [Capsulimonadales bacterium]
MAAVLEPPVNTFDPQSAPAPIALTARAAQEVKDILEQQGNPEGVYLRVYVAGGGCSGLQYGMALDENVEEGDAKFPAYVQYGDEVSGGISHEVDPSFEVVIDSMSHKYILGSIVDYVTTPMGGGFKVENPNAVRSCGCGSSFSTEDDAEGRTVTGGCGSCRA